ncbi:DNA-binding protein [Salinisphaera orenii MK-B5]|uniref:Transcriptional regulator MntR n=2 Tax=Salinisphaera orenii TaxID=856731 RepID=A0A423PGB0_9GAMM|nr:MULTISPECIES: manganese-binding transcriptional regulator MntR [Salinisphaera]ROO24647.1 DNA-binding protein [Salinisphaera orenii MK-B5]ROO29624.1 DNA-binding protein [Salinisphaera halophila YIM 95161]
MNAERTANDLDHVLRADTSGELLDPADHARQYSYVRKAHETELIEDYVELIADLIDAKGEARAVELAQRMGVTQATVGKMIRRMTDAGLVTSEPYRSIFLTEDGKRMACESRDRHIVVLRFLRALGVPETTARKDAEGVEHHVSAETIEIMRRFADDRDGAQDD